MRGIVKTPANSLLVGELARGCELCMEGAKLVLFVTGMCDRRCYYCPLSEERRWKDVVYANELLVKKEDDIIKEAKLMDALGAGITGGDPLVRPRRTLRFIKLLKKTFGKEFHIHLYTSGTRVNLSLLRQLEKAGLDELRFHPAKPYWHVISLATKTKITVGGEMPAIPGNEKRLMEFAKYLENVGAKFLNLNEFEFSETNAEQLKKRGFRLKEGSLAAVEGSEECAIEILKWAAENSTISVHYCPSRLKDAVQLRNRLLRRARNVAKPYDEISEDGLLIKGVIEPKRPTCTKLIRIRRILIEEFDIPEELVGIDFNKGRVETAWCIVEELATEIKRLIPNIKIGIVEEYPTADRILISYNPL